jgi:hypothetical protein
MHSILLRELFEHFTENKNRRHLFLCLNQEVVAEQGVRQSL